MEDFFIVSHKYATNNMNGLPELSTKSWHLNDAIKKLLMSLYTPVNGMYHIAQNDSSKLVAPNSDSVSDDTFVFNSGKGVVINGVKLNLDSDAS